MISATIAIVTLDGFNEIDSFVAARMLDSVPGLSISLAGPGDRATSAAGVTVDTPTSLLELASADAVIIGSGFATFDHIENADLMAELGGSLHSEQLVASQCSGAAFLERLGLLDGVAVCTDRLTAQRLADNGVEVEVTFEAFRADGNLASAGGCLSSAYLACWIITRLAGWPAAEDALRKVAPVGEEEAFVQRCRSAVLVGQDGDEPSTTDGS